MILELKKINFIAIKVLFFKRCRYSEVLVSKKNSSAEKVYKYFIGYVYDDYKVKPLHIILPKTSAYVKTYDTQTTWVYFLIEGNDLWKKYSTIWDKVSADIKKEFDSDTVYNEKFL